MGIRNFPFITVGDGLGTRRAAIAAPSAVLIPVMANGLKPKFLHLAALGGLDTNIITVTPNFGANGTFSDGFPLSPIVPDGVILNVHGFSHIGYADSGDGTTDLYLQPLEDF